MTGAALGCRGTGGSRAERETGWACLSTQAGCVVHQDASLLATVLECLVTAACLRRGINPKVSVKARSGVEEPRLPYHGLETLGRRAWSLPGVCKLRGRCFAS